MRPTRQEMLMSVAQTVALRGTCDRKQVGAVIAREGRIIAVGYNGAPPGLPHCSENLHGWKGVYPEGARPHPDPVQEAQELQEWHSDMLRNEGCRNATHAEANALAFAARHGVSTDEAELFVTVSPCLDCARLLIAAGIMSVNYEEAYRDDSGLMLLNQALVPIKWSTS